MPRSIRRVRLGKKGVERRFAPFLYLVGLTEVGRILSRKSPEHAVATQALQPSLAQPVEAPKDLPVSDDYSVIRNELSSEGYLADGAIMDVPGVAPGATFHVQKVTCTAMAEPCRKLFVFLGSESVWSEDLAGYTPKQFNRSS
jgi:hypothetical protein